MNATRNTLATVVLALAAGALSPACASAPSVADTRPAPLPVANPGEATATFAGGCFWCLETAFEGVPGIRFATSGYCGGTEKHPTYEEVGSGRTGQAESVQIIFDPKVVSYAAVLERFWHNIDPFSVKGQFCDRGLQYRSAIFVHDDEQRRLALKTRAQIEARFGRKVMTEIATYREFWPAEGYHQDFYRKDPERYHSYREGCGRDRILRAIWGKDAGQGPTADHAAPAK